MAPSRQTLLDTTKTFLSNYNEWTIESVLSTRSPSCIHRTAPSSMSTPDRSNEEFAKMLGSAIPTFRNFQLKLVEDMEPIIDTELRQVVLCLRSTANTDVESYNNEYVFILKISEDGKLVDEIVEFLDSQYTAGIVGRLQEKVGKRL